MNPHTLQLTAPSSTVTESVTHHVLVIYKVLFYQASEIVQMLTHFITQHPKSYSNITTNPTRKLNYLESVTRYKLNQASQNSFKKGSNFIICKSIVSCFPRSNRFTSFIFENISRFLMDNFDPCEHMQVSITSLQLIL